MSLASAAVEKRTVTTFTTALCLLAGMAAFFGLGQLEDPEFTVKTAVVSTMYPGATAEEVELEVTDRVELAIQEMPQLKELESFSRAGFSLVSAYIKPEYQSDELPQVWDELRKKIRDMSGQLPPGAGTPVVSDDFGDVYGFLMAVVGDGFSYAELERYVDAIKKELSLVEGVARVELWGVQQECIYVESSRARLSQLGLTKLDMQKTLLQQNLVVDSGGIDVGNQRLRVETTGEFDSPEDIGSLAISGQNLTGTGDEALLRIRDIAEIRRGYVEPPTQKMRCDGQPSIGIAISNVSGANIVDLGRAIDARLDVLMAQLPVGIEFRKISWQSDLVATSVNDFMISLMQAVVIVLVVLWLAMGLRTALIVGMCGLAFTIIISFVFMKLLGVDLQRMSLGALVVAMGMMVDNAIVVVDGIVVRMERGMDRVKAAIEAAQLPSIPLLGATVVAVMAFYPIAASTESAGEYCASLFSVVGLSLMLSWVLSVTITPVMCIMLLPAPKEGGGDPFGGKMYRMFEGMLTKAIHFRWIVIVAMLVLLVVSAGSFRFVDQLFFPASARAQLMIDYWAPEGTRIQDVSKALVKIEQRLMDDPVVERVSTFIGAGPQRFYLPVDPESPYPSYGQLIVNTHSYEGVQKLLGELQPWFDENVPEALVVMRKYGLGPSETWAVEARISGPAVADPGVLRRLGDEIAAVMEQSEHALLVRTDWRQRVKKIVLDYDERNARWTNVSRADIADSTRLAYDGSPIGQFREGDKMLPILSRLVDEERRDISASLGILQVRPMLGTEPIPLAQVTSSIDVQWEDPLIWRWDRRRAITVQAVPVNLATTLRNDVLAAVEAVPLPPGYELMWDGEFRSSRDAQQSLIPGIIPAGLLVALIVVGLFNAYRPPLVIMCTIPFALIGIVVGLLVTRQPFGFVALLGGMSLAGMMIKNAIVLLDQINIEKADGKGEYEAVIAAAVCRLRPVVLAAATTVLGVIPLLGDVFWVGLAVTIMFGLTFGTILTMVAVPVLYATFFGLKAPEKA